MDELVFKGENNHALTNSLLVAEKFGKLHRDVIRAIENIFVSAQNCAETDYQQVKDMFMFSEYEIELNNGTGAKRKTPFYIMNRDGFSLLAMGFTGPKALEFKLKYVNAFNNMEAMLNADTIGLALRVDKIEQTILAQESEIDLLRDVNVELHRTNCQMMYKVAAFDAQMHMSETLYTTTAVAQELGTSANKLNRLMQERKIIYKQGNRWIISAPYVTEGYHKIRTRIDENNHTRMVSMSYITWTEKGRMFLLACFDENTKILPDTLTKITNNYMRGKNKL